MVVNREFQAFVIPNAGSMRITPKQTTQDRAQELADADVEELFARGATEIEIVITRAGESVFSRIIRKVPSVVVGRA